MKTRARWRQGRGSDDLRRYHGRRQRDKWKAEYDIEDDWGSSECWKERRRLAGGKFEEGDLELKGSCARTGEFPVDTSMDGRGPQVGELGRGSLDYGRRMGLAFPAIDVRWN
jgi:hypothetical protein